MKRNAVMIKEGPYHGLSAHSAKVLLNAYESMDRTPDLKNRDAMIQAVNEGRITQQYMLKFRGIGEVAFKEISEWLGFTVDRLTEESRYTILCPHCGKQLAPTLKAFVASLKQQRDTSGRLTPLPINRVAATP